MGSGAPRPPGLRPSYALDPAPSSRAPAAPGGGGPLTLPSPPTARIVGPPSGHGPASRVGDPVPLGVPAMAVDRSPYHPSVLPDAPEGREREEELQEALDAAQATPEEGGPAAGHLP